MIKPLVYGEGPKQCKIAFVGEALGADEVHLLRPFVGSAGEELDRCMASAGIIREHCYITNVIKERPINNKIAQFLKLPDGKGKKIIETPEYQEYKEMLKEELKGCSANVIVALGAVPLYALTGYPTGITKRRGSIYTSTLLLGRKVVACIHPAAALRQYIYHYYILMDMQRVSEESATPDIRLPERRLRTMPSFDDIMAYIESCYRCKTVGFDIETSVHYIKGKKYAKDLTHVSLATHELDAISIPFVFKGKEYMSLQEEKHVMLALAKLLESEDVGKTGQNLNFDITFMFSKYGIRTAGKIDDTMVAHAVYMPDFPKGLDFLTATYTREPYYKDEGKQHAKLYVSDLVFQEYSAKDAAICLEIMPKVEAELRKQGNYDTYRTHVDMLKPIGYIQQKGILINTDKLSIKQQEVGGKIDKLTEQFESDTGGVNPNSSKQLMELFYIRKGLAPYVNRQTGNWTTDKTALIRLARKGVKEANTVLNIRQLSKLKSTYLDMRLDGRGRMVGSFNTVGAADSGRLSSSINIFGHGMNMQNLDPVMKEFMCADPDHLIFDVDLSQAENRIVAYIAPEPKMISAFESGQDVHNLTASSIFSIAPDQISDEEGSAANIGDGRLSQRAWGKRSNHSFNYGMRHVGMALRYIIPEPQALILYNSYHRQYPGIKNYYNWVVNDLRMNGRTLVNPFGRRRTFMGRWGQDLFREAYSFIPQSTTADIINRRGLLYISKNEEFFEGLQLLSQVHDSIVFQMPVSAGFVRMAQMLNAIKDALQTPVTFKDREFVIPADVKCGFNLKDVRKLKEITVETLTAAYNDLRRTI